MSHGHCGWLQEMPGFLVCPLKGIIGDYKKKEEPKPKSSGAESDQNN